MFPLLDSLFTEYVETYARIAKCDIYAIERHIAERLLEQARAAGIEGTEKLAANAGDFRKFVNLLAELRFALLFANTGASVRLLGDQEFGKGNIYTPDLLVTFSSGIRILVEVTRTSNGAADVIAALQNEIESSGLLFTILPVLGLRLSIPDLNAEARTESERLAAELAREAVVAVGESQAKGHRSGVVHVLSSGGSLRREVEAREVGGSLPSESDAPRREGEEWIASFVFEPSTLEQGYARGGLTSVHWMDAEAQKEKFLREVQRKAAKRSRLPAEFAATPFVVAIQNDEIELMPTMTLTALTGSRCAFGGPESERASWMNEGRARYPSEVEAAAQLGWRRLLTAWEYESNARCVLTDFGAYHSAEWAKNVSATIVTHHGGALTQWLPNPFAQPSIADPRLLEIGLPLDMLGSG